jgi:hypothetical protein
MTMWMKKEKASLIAIVVSLAVLLSGLVAYLAINLPSESDEDLPIVEHLGIAIDSEDQLHVVWDDGRDDEIYIFDNWYLTTRVYHSKFDSDGQRIIDDVPITSGGGRYPSIEIDSDDSIWVSYLMDGSFLMKLNPEGENLLERRVLDQYDAPLMVSIGSDDNIYLSWNECWQLQCFRYYMALDTNGDILTDRTNVSLVTPIPGIPVVLDDNGKFLYLDNEGGTDASNNIHIVSRSQSNELYYTRRGGTGGIIVNNTRISSDEVWRSLSKVVIDSYDDIHVLASTRSGLGYLKLDNMGNVLSEVTGIKSEDGDDTAIHPELDVGSSGNVYIVWNVIDTTLPYPGSGLERHTYASYCAKIDGSGVLEAIWLVAESKRSDADSSGSSTVVVLIGVVLALFIVSLLLLWRSVLRRRAK